LTQGCGPSKPEGSTPFLEEAAKDKPVPYNKLLDGSFPSLRQDSFYTTYKEENGKKDTLDDRFVSNGKGFVAYSEQAGFDHGYYLYNFYGHTSFYVVIPDRSYRVALTSPGDDLIYAYQMLSQSRRSKAPAGSTEVTKLGTKTFDGADCQGLSYTDKDGAKHEEWFAQSDNRLIDQTVEGPRRKLSRHLKRANAICDTIMLRLPEGYTLEK
jgi:hypothetical protein